MVYLSVAIIVDIDDTLLRNGTQPIQRTIDYINSIPGAKYLVTGRNASMRLDTVKALRDAGIRFTSLYMNPKNGGDNEFKYETAVRLSKAHKIEVAIDNNPDARAAYRRAGLKTLDPAHLPNPKKMWEITYG
jgi:hydroxymethylpyrimidine pyrophosphatase-like HAD family hydrolase